MNEALLLIVNKLAATVAADSTDAMAFAALHGIEPIVQTYPLKDA